VQVEVNRQSLTGVLLVRPSPVGHTAGMSERDDYADGDLQPAPRWPRDVLMILGGIVVAGSLWILASVCS